MKSKLIAFLSLVLFCNLQSNAQQTKPLSIPDAVHLALEQSDESKINQAQVTTSTHEVQVAKTLQYPDVTAGGQYRYLTHVDFSSDLLSGEDAESSTIPDVNQFLMGNLDISMPIFSGFKIKNTIEASKNILEATTYKAKNNDEKLALETINLYISLYKAEQSITMFEDNLVSAKQRVTDFTNMEQNGLLARNDLLKAQLQESQVQISLENAKKTKNILNYRLVSLLKLPEDTKIETISENFGIAPATIETDTFYRNDLEALKAQERATENQIKIAKGNYYPSIGIVGGYMAVDVPNAFTLTNAMNIGVGLSYNFSEIFKNKSEVAVAKSKADELKYTIDKATDAIKVEIENASQEYQLALKKLNLYAKSEEQAIENYRIVKDKFDNGLADTNDTLEADLEQLQAKINLAFAKADISQKYYELLTAQGQLTTLINN
ncbi:TolC family protein [Formosa algae]|uniref:Outer membrane protein TolC n=1 Tax=Formosa algae TaxID=225843 RepID=A0A9X1CBM4_9FLAO|nr:TolC family protein [Formosa algae]MBP1839375.1 outer membrane protein TolC [Formosa algae]MDQ0334679.1 outer membrane protein TolC [Formosa algae]OEI81289.1 transporter [Formosa algae]